MGTSLTQVNLVPEWTVPDRLMMVWPEYAATARPKGDLQQMRAEWVRIAQRVAHHVPLNVLVSARSSRLLTDDLKNPRIELITTPEKPDIWIRDWGPVRATTSAGQAALVFARYMPSYHDDKSVSSYERKLQKNPAGVFPPVPFATIPLIWDLGNVAYNGRGDIIVTDQLLKDNKITEQRLREILSESLDFERLLIMPVEPGDVTGHTDGFLRFIDDSTIAVGEYPTREPASDAFYEEVIRILQEHQFSVVRVPCDDPVSEMRDEVPSAYGNRLNWIRIGDLVLMPGYGTAGDAQSRKVLETVGLRVEIVPREDLTEISHHGGILHCITCEV